jgi:hypothetical protein
MNENLPASLPSAPKPSDIETSLPAGDRQEALINLSEVRDKWRDLVGFGGSKDNPNYLALDYEMNLVAGAPYHIRAAKENTKKYLNVDNVSKEGFLESLKLEQPTLATFSEKLTDMTYLTYNSNREATRRRDTEIVNLDWLRVIDLDDRPDSRPVIVMECSPQGFLGKEVKIVHVEGKAFV